MTEPISSSTWTKGKEYTITWDYNGTFSHVTIELYQSESLALTIAANTSNNGSYKWTVDMNLTDDTTYRIKIISTSDAEVYGYSDYFEIEDVPAIEVTSPTSNSTWIKGTEYSITWDYHGTFSDVKIELYESESLALTIAASMVNDGSYTWTVDKSLPAGTSYRIKVTSTSDAEVYDYSDYFAIEDEKETLGFLVIVVVLALAIVVGVRVRRRRN